MLFIAFRLVTGIFVLNLVSATDSYSGAVWNESRIIHSFLSDHIASVCLIVNSMQSPDCIERTNSIHNSVKLMKYYGSIVDLNEKVGVKLLDMNWTNHIEGNSFSMREKELKLQHFANDDRVKTICEVGFNAGYSATNFLVSNPMAKLLTFDLFRHNYTAKALDVLYEQFPDRDIISIAGDSTKSIPKFYNSLHSVNVNIPLCNLIFIDGGHEEDVAYADIMNMMMLADPSYNVLIIDDLESNAVRSAVNRALAEDIMKYEEIINGLVKYNYFDWTLMEGGGYNITHGYFEKPVKGGGMLIGSYKFNYQ